MLKFTKMHGLGNDFIIINDLDEKIPETDYEKMAILLCDRHLGVGGDGIIFVMPSKKADYKMRIINSDGSEAEMCGNGIRCFTKYVVEKLAQKKQVISVETLAGIIVPTVITDNGHIMAVEVDMGEPRLRRKEIPMTGADTEKVINEEITVAGKKFTGTAVSMGNPHFIVFVDNTKEFPVSQLGPLFETHPLFPEKTNTEFIQVVNENELIMRVWERGAGETMACGTGACASLVAAVLNGKCKRKAIIHLRGGDLSIQWQEDDNHVIMTGPASAVFEGEIGTKLWK